MEPGTLMMLHPMPEPFAGPDPKVNRVPCPEERRVYRRWAPERDTAARFLTEQSPVSLWARVLDVSQGGLGLLLSQRLPEGTSFILEVRDRSDKTCHRLRARIVHVTEVDRGAYRTGTRLERALREGELDSLFT